MEHRWRCTGVALAERGVDYGYARGIRTPMAASEVNALIAANSLVTPRYELVSGELLVTPSPGPFHQKAISELFRVLLPYLEREPVGVLITSPSDVELEAEFVAQPDMCVVPTTEWRRVMAEGFPGSRAFAGDRG